MEISWLVCVCVCVFMYVFMCMYYAYIHIHLRSLRGHILHIFVQTKITKFVQTKMTKFVHSACTSLLSLFLRALLVMSNEHMLSFLSPLHLVICFSWYQPAINMHYLATSHHTLPLFFNASTKEVVIPQIIKALRYLYAFYAFSVCRNYFPQPRDPLSRYSRRRTQNMTSLLRRALEGTSAHRGVFGCFN